MQMNGDAPVVITHEVQSAIQAFLDLEKERKLHVAAAQELANQKKQHFNLLRDFLSRCPDMKLPVSENGEFLRTHVEKDYKPLTQARLRELINSFCDHNNMMSDDAKSRNLFIHSLASHLWKGRTVVHNHRVAHVTPHTGKRVKREERESGGDVMF